MAPAGARDRLRGEVVVLGLITDAAGAPYLIDLAAAAAVVLTVLLAAATAAGAGLRMRWIVPAVWGVVVLPVTALGPLLTTAGCRGTPCELLDFGGALPLAIAPASFVLLALLMPRSRRNDLPAPGTRASVLLGGALWAAFVVWIAAMEGLVDAYTPLLLVAGGVGPGVGAAVWLIVDRLRRSARPPARSLALGALAGIVATMAGAATVAIPWSVAVAVLAGVISAVIARGRTRSVARAGWVVLAAGLIGLVAPVVSGDAIGVLFTAQIEAVPVPLVAAGAVAGFAALVSLPVWLGIRFGSRSPAGVPSGWAIPDSN
ncbi:hypothetical protein GCM10025881_37290 [Pseudolysinimonas kribbensis]|uniref:Ammonium transporter AmtB-like domain-containing protein n=1 Tax=Pseudolysinimonas kribbensis TaxID=433641 RepID=A0ABQ6KBQ5_9MICO|nr:hypothetical protein [Pseudolysinimonas kribbensis]GMA96905.1 hypothetical protein GCM10025881_37290 [Pseudolysinimonas kribbensis]